MVNEKLKNAIEWRWEGVILDVWFSLLDPANLQHTLGPGFGVRETTKQGVLPGCDKMTATPQLQRHRVGCGVQCVTRAAPAGPFRHLSCLLHVCPFPSYLLSELLKGHPLSAFVSHCDLL